MRKDQLHRRSNSILADTNESSEVENGDPLLGSADPFDALVNSKEESTSKSNGKKAPSPIPDDSDVENDTEAKNDDNSEQNGDDEKNDDEENKLGIGEDSEDAGYEVENIVGHKFKGVKKYFKIRWKNFGESDDTWELEDDLSCPDIIERYLLENPAAKENKTKQKKEKKEKKEKKVRISLPSAAPTRAAPKRTAAERKVIVDDVSDSEETGKKRTKKSPPGKVGRPKKAAAGKSPGKKEEYEVEKIIDDELRSGKTFYRIRWKGWSAKDDTWEPKSSLSCPDIIKAYESSKEQEYEVEKIVGEKVEYGKRFFLVKWKGWTEGDNSWEAATEVDCYDLIEKFRESCRSLGKSTKRASSAAPKSPKAAKKARKAVSDDDDDADDESEDEKEWEVEKIINVRKARGGKKEYLIRWKGCKAADDTWEPENQISSPELIAAFLKKNKK